MPNFQQRKNDVLLKKDKSSIGEWDSKIVPLCEKINSLDNYYTTSSCSGRIMIMDDNEKKGPGLFYFFSHDKVKKLPNMEGLKGNYKFKQEPVIFHVACKTLEDAQELLRKGQEAGFKRCGVISLGRNIVVEINSTEKIDFPLIEKGKLLVSKEFLEKVLVKANKNLEKGWQKIEKFEELF